MCLLTPAKTGFPFPSPRDLPDPGIKTVSPILQADSVPSAAPGKPQAGEHIYLCWPHPWGLMTTSFHLGFQWLRSKGRQSQFLLLPSVWLVESKARKHQLWGLILNMRRNRVPKDGAPLSQKGTCSESYFATSL